MFWFVSRPFFLEGYESCVVKSLLIVHNAFNCCSFLLVGHNGLIVVDAGRSQRLEIVVYRVVGRQGVDFERSHE